MSERLLLWFVNDVFRTSCSSYKDILHNTRPIKRRYKNVHQLNRVYSTNRQRDGMGILDKRTRIDNPASMSDSNMTTRVEHKKNHNGRKRCSNRMLLVVEALAQLVFSWDGGICENAKKFPIEFPKERQKSGYEHQRRQLLMQCQVIP